MVIASYPQQMKSRIGQVLLDRLHISDIINVKIYRGANIHSTHYLIIIKMRFKLPVVNNERYRRPPQHDLQRLNYTDVATASFYISSKRNRNRFCLLKPFLAIVLQ